MKLRLARVLDINFTVFDGLLFIPRSAKQMSLGGWCAEDSDMNPYLQVDLVNNSIITAIATQGVPANGNLALRYKLNYSCDGKSWFDYQQGKVTFSSRSLFS